MFSEIKKVWQYRELLASIVRRDMSARYKNSLFGFIWSLINPLLTVVVLVFIFKDNTPNFSAYVLAAYLPYMFFNMSIMDATGSILASVGLLKKVYFPREIIPIASVLANFIHFALAMVVFFVYMVFLWAIHSPHVFPLQPTAILLPVLLLISLLMATGLGLLLSALNTFFEDVKYMTQFLMSMLFFLSPIMYMIEPKVKDLGPVGYKLYVYLNPIGIICNAFRKTLLAPQKVGNLQQIGIEWNHIAYATAFALVVFFGGYHVFNQVKWRFVERP